MLATGFAQVDRRCDNIHGYPPPNSHPMPYILSAKSGTLLQELPSARRRSQWWHSSINKFRRKFSRHLKARAQCIHVDRAANALALSW